MPLYSRCYAQSQWLILLSNFSGAIGKLPDAEPHELPSTSEEVPEDEEDDEEIHQRLAALRS